MKNKVSTVIGIAVLACIVTAATSIFTISNTAVFTSEIPTLANGMRLMPATGPPIVSVVAAARNIALGIGKTLMPATGPPIVSAFVNKVFVYSGLAISITAIAIYTISTNSFLDLNGAFREVNKRIRKVKMSIARFVSTVFKARLFNGMFPVFTV